MQKKNFFFQTKPFRGAAVSKAEIYSSKCDKTTDKNKETTYSASCLEIQNKFEVMHLPRTSEFYPYYLQTSTENRFPHPFYGAQCSNELQGSKRKPNDERIMKA